MPVAPATWNPGPVTASSLNTAMYTYSPGNNHAPTGVLFHSAPPMLSEIARSALGFSQASSPSGASSETLLMSQGNWQNMGDTSALFSVGGDRPGQSGSGQYISRVPGSDGTAGSTGGWHLIWGFPAWAAQSSAGGAGAALAQTNVSPGNLAFGGFQRASTSQRNASYVLDLQHCAASPAGYVLQGLCADTSSGSFAYVTSAAYSGSGCRLSSLWGSAAPGGSQAPVGSLPAPQALWTATTGVTDTMLNSVIGDVVQLLNLPPALRAGTALSTTLPAATATAVPLGSTAQLDSWSGLSSSVYTVPVDGVYLVHACPSIGTVTSGDAYAGVFVNGTSTRWFGPAHTMPGASATTVRPQMTRLMDLRAGDTIQLLAYASTASALSNGLPSRLIVKWMASLAASSGSVSWTPPDMWHRWQAGTPGAGLPAEFTATAGNDLSFLVNRPYLLAYQTAAQTSLPSGSWEVLQMQTVTGMVHGAAGDNYGGWVSGAANRYVAQVPGWYLAVLSVSQSSPSATAVHGAGIGYYTASGAAQGSTPDVYQIVASNTSGALPGAEAIGLYYLDAGDYLQPQYQEVTGPTYSTSVAAGHNSSFGVVWVSE